MSDPAFHPAPVVRSTAEGTAEWEKTHPQVSPSKIASQLGSAWVGNLESITIDIGGFPFFEVCVTAGGRATTFSYDRSILTLDDRGAGQDPLSCFGEWPDRPTGVVLDAMIDVVSLMDGRGIGLTVSGVGKHAWLRAGFLPDGGSWMMLKPALLHKLAIAYHLDIISSKVFDEASMACVGSEPKMIRIVSAISDKAPCSWLYTGSERSTAALGRIVVIEGPMEWCAVLDTRDKTALAMCRSTAFGIPPSSTRRDGQHEGPWGRYGKDPDTLLLDLGTELHWDSAVAEARRLLPDTIASLARRMR
jgi:hypothetical protein